MRNPYLEVDEIEGNFKASVEDGRKLEVICSDCGTTVQK
jgi:hypothetical protein